MDLRICGAVAVAPPLPAVTKLSHRCCPIGSCYLGENARSAQELWSQLQRVTDKSCVISLCHKTIDSSIARLVRISTFCNAQACLNPLLINQGVAALPARSSGTKSHQVCRNEGVSLRALLHRATYEQSCQYTNGNPSHPSVCDVWLAGLGAQSVSKHLSEMFFGNASTSAV